MSVKIQALFSHVRNIVYAFSVPLVTTFVGPSDLILTLTLLGSSVILHSLWIKPRPVSLSFKGLHVPTQALLRFYLPAFSSKDETGVHTVSVTSLSSLVETACSPRLRS